MKSKALGKIPDDYTFSTEKKEQDLVRNIIKPDMIVFDIGAHLGKYTKLFSLLVGNNGKVFAFEPTPDSFAKIQKDISELTAENIFLYNTAVYSKKTSLKFHQFPEKFSSWNGIGKPEMDDPDNPQNLVPHIKTIEVEAITIDEFCEEKNINRIDYLKLDVEGSEIFALRGMKRMLQKKAIKYLQFEISKQMLEGCNTNASDVFDFLINCGYNCKEITDSGSIGKSVNDSDSFYENYIAFPEQENLTKNLCEIYQTNNLSFDFFLPELNTEQTNHFNELYTAYSFRRIFKELKSIFNELVYLPIWNGSPTKISEWRESKVSSVRFNWLLKNSENTIPDFHFYLKEKLNEYSDSIPIKETFRILNTGLLKVTQKLNEIFNSTEKKNLESKLSFKEWNLQLKGRDEEKLLIEFYDFIQKKNIDAVLLHGSLADGNTEIGFSDFDVTFILKIPANPADDNLFLMAEAVLKSNQFLLAYNPFMHHGPLISFKDELNWSTEASFPSVLVENGVWLKGGIKEIGYFEDGLDYILSFSPFDNFFNSNFQQPTDFHNPFDIIWWSSSVMFLPLLVTQMLEGKSIWKRDLFTRKNDHIPDMYWDLLAEVSSLRKKAAKLIQSKVSLPLEIEVNDNNPGLLLRDAKEKSHLNINEIQSLGITKDILENTKEFWQYCKNTAFYYHLQNKNSNKNNFGIFSESWPVEVTEIPIPLSIDDYNETREYFLNLCKSNINIISVYEFGHIGSPGLSDLDLLVILDDNFSGIPKELVINSMPKKYAEVFNHNPIFISESSLQSFGAVFPLFKCEKIYGKEQSIQFTKEFNKNVQLSLFTFINVLKYPRDIIYLSKQKQVRWKTFLAYLNSFKHIERAFSELNIQTPLSIQECIKFNEKVRSNFNQNKISLDDLKTALKLMIEASTDMLLVFEFIWAEVLPELKSIYGLTDKDKYVKEVFKCLNRNETTYPDLPKILKVLMLHFQKIDDYIDIPSTIFEKFSNTFSEYLMVKAKFIQNELTHNRQIDHYISGNLFSTIPQQDNKLDYSLAKVDELKSPQFEWFMFKLNAFAHEHSLREMINWSKIWEYPWIWFHALMNINFEGKTVVDLGSEISPIPWLLASKGAKVILIETDEQYLSHWKHLNEKLGLNVEWKFVSNEEIPLSDNSADILTSYSVLEHQPDKNKAVKEVVRILKPGGVFALSFDICERDIGMTFPDWNGTAIDLNEFENILWKNPAFQKTDLPQWNLQDMKSFWQWHLNTAQHHNYVTAAAVFKNHKPNKENNINNIPSENKSESLIQEHAYTTPILFLIYNRPELTNRVFKEIKKIKPSRLYIAADGPKPNDQEDKIKCDSTRNIINNIDWKCDVKTLFRTDNLGCKRGVSSAIDWFFENEEKGIILEDDIFPSITFWKFCEEMLFKYADDSRIMQVTGNNLQFGWRRTDDSYYFSLYGSIWGWATWRRAWQLYDIDMKSYPDFLQKNLLKDIYNNDDEVNFRKKTFDFVYEHNLDTWDFQWTFAKLVNSGLSIVPNTNLIRNIGFGEDATHTKAENDIRANLLAGDMGFPLKHPKWIIRDRVSDNRYFKIITKVESGKPGAEILRELNSDLSRFNKDELKSNTKNIVYVRLDSIGDNVLAASTLPLIKDKYGNSNLTIICQEHIAELYRDSAFAENVVTIDKNKYEVDENYREELLNNLKELPSDLVLNSVYSRDEIGDEIVKNINADVKVGFFGDSNNLNDDQREKNNSFYTHLIEIENSFISELEKQRKFLAYLDINVDSLLPFISVTDKDRENVKDLLIKNEFHSNNYLVLFSGAQNDIRNYPFFGKSISKIAKENNLGVIALGSENDFAINQINLDDLNVPTLNLSGRTSIQQAAALIENAVFSIGSETGLAHISCAVNTPNVILLGGGHFGRFMPYSNLTSVVALPLDCFRCNWACVYSKAYCVKDVDVRVIEEAVNQTIKRTSDKARVFIQTYFSPEINKDVPAWFFDDEMLKNNDVEIIKVNNTISLDKIEELISTKNYDEALNSLQGLLNYNSNDVNVLNNIAVVQILTKRWEEASQVLLTILNIEPENQVALENVRYLEQQLVYYKSILDSEDLIKQQKLLEAKEILQEILNYEPEHVDALNNLAVVKIYIGDFAGAEELLFQVLELNPDDEIAIDNLSYLKKLLHKPQDLDEIEKEDIQFEKDKSYEKKELSNTNYNNKNEILLSIVLQGRNDGYMGNFEWRLSTNINKLVQNISRLQFQNKVQVILVDWGSVEPLANELSLSDQAKSILNIIYVEKAIADKYNKDSEYSMVHAINTGIRRAKGEYILFCDGDTYIPQETLDKILVLISGNHKTDIILDQSLIMASRYHIPKSFQQANPTLDEIDNYIKANQSLLDHDKINLIDFSGTSTGYLMSEKLWKECTGFDESLIYWGWFDIDLFHRISGKYKVYDFEEIGMPFFHLEHYSNSKNRDMQSENPRKINPGAMPSIFSPNDFNWGLYQEDIFIDKIKPEDVEVKDKISKSELDNLIPPEIKDDEFYNEIIELASSKDIRTVLEIGSSAGCGSTEAFVKGLRNNPNSPLMFCMEVSKTRFAELKNRYEKDEFVKCYNVSSIAIEDFPSKNKVSEFYNSTKTTLNQYPLEQVLSWLDQDIEYVKTTGVSDDGIRRIREDINIQNFDLVLIDGSEFTGSVELSKVYGAKYILLDDINAYKNYESYNRLKNDTNYNLIKENWNTRNGYAIFKFNDSELPVHFFTIVLNGEPFIRYHIELFKQLPFKWHWHIIEGVAELKNDTAWSVPLGGKVTDEFHRNGLSNDGTSEYLNELGNEYQENITIYRKMNGEFWDGKLEMVNAPLNRIKEETLLFEIDSDELWTFEQLLKTRELFIKNPSKTAAFFWCHFYVGENLVTTEKNEYSKTPIYEWIRAWRFKPGCRWISHEPPALCEQNENGEWTDLIKVNPFTHDETEKNGLMYHHYAYVLEEQLKFKEIYYGYKNALQDWKKLQTAGNYPLQLKNYFSWVNDLQKVNTLASQNINPIARKDENGNWNYNYVTQNHIQKVPSIHNIHDENRANIKQSIKKKDRIIIDGAIFQLQKNRPHGIYRVWESLLTEFAKSDFADRILLLDRESSAPKIPNLQTRVIHSYTYVQCDVDSHYLQDICDEEDAVLFISTYYTYPDRTHNILLLHDMIPEVMNWQSDDFQWIARSKALKKANAYFSVSDSTKNDFKKYYLEELDKKIYVVNNGVTDKFKKNKSQEVDNFKRKYNLNKPYFILSGNRDKYKNAILFFKALNKLENKDSFQVLLTGGANKIEDEFLPYLENIKYQLVLLSDEELSIAYSGAVSLVYPSKYEGFGLPILEAMKSGCPVITCKNSSIPDVAGNAVIYVNENNVQEMKQALISVQNSEVRNQLIEKGFINVKRFSWEKSANKYTEHLLHIIEEYKNKELNISTPLNENNQFYYAILKNEKLGKAHSRLVDLLIDGITVDPEKFRELEKVLIGIEQAEFYSSLSLSNKSKIKDPFFCYVEGLIYQKNNEAQKALASYMDSLNAGWTHWRIGYLAALAAIDINDLNIAKQLLQMVLKAKPDYKDAADKLPFVEDLINGNETDNNAKVSAIVSTYNSEEFIRGCLDDLINQTLCKKGELEIIVVVSGSEENEEEIVKEYKKTHSNIKLIVTKERETVYKSWNRGIKEAKGKYITNSNTDDRHRHDALEILSEELDENLDTVLVYADSKVTQTENRTFDNTPLSGYLLWPQFDRKKLFEICFVGPHPMWRKSLHEQYGYFDENFRSAGDYEFWLRISLKEKFKHINELLGLYLLSKSSIENSDPSTSFNESELARQRYWIGNGNRPKPAGAYFIPYKESKLQLGEPLFSVVLTTSSKPEDLYAALISLKNQTYKNFEVVIVNDGKDDLSNLINEFEGKIYIRYLHHIINMKRSTSRNDAIKIAKGKYLAFLEYDNLYNPNHLQVLFENCNDHEKVIYTDIVSPMHTEFYGEHKIDDIKSKSSSDYSRDRLLNGRIVPLSCFAISKSVALIAGLFDESFKELEDWEFLLRVSKISDFKYCSQSTVKVNSKTSYNSNEEVKNKNKEKERIYKMYEKELSNIKIKGELEDKDDVQQVTSSFIGSENIFLASFKDATKNMRNKDFQSAANNIKIAIENYNETRDNNLIEFSTLLDIAGNIALYNNDLQDAKNYFEDELINKPDSATACFGLAELFFLEENYHDAKKMYEWAVKNNPNYDLALKGLGKVNKLLQLPEDDNTLQVNSEPYSLDKANELLKEARINFESKSFGEALELVTDAERLIEKGSLNGEEQELVVSLNNFKGYCNVGLNNLDDAKMCFENALQIEPNSSETCAGLGEVLYLSGNDDEAKIMYEWAIKNDSANTFAIHGLKKVNNNLGLEETHNSLLIVN